MGSEINPIEITEAEITPVVAASMAPTRTTAMAKPPLMGPNNCPMVSSKSSAIPDRSSTKPIRVKKGTANKVSLEIMPYIRWGNAWNKAGCIKPNSMATKPYKIPTAASVKATGKPNNKKTIKLKNMIGARLDAIKSNMDGPLADGDYFFCCSVVCCSVTACAYWAISSAISSSERWRCSASAIGSGAMPIKNPIHLIKCDTPDNNNKDRKSVVYGKREN